MHTKPSEMGGGGGGVTSPFNGVGALIMQCHLFPYLIYRDKLD